MWFLESGDNEPCSQRAPELAFFFSLSALSNEDFKKNKQNNKKKEEFPLVFSLAVVLLKGLNRLLETPTPRLGPSVFLLVLSNENY